MRRIASALFAVAALTGVSAAMAQATPNAYVSLSAGPSRANFDCTGTTSCDKTDVAARILFGYRVMPNLAIEATYASLGKAKATVDFDGTLVDGSIKGTSLGVGVAGLMPFGAAKEWTGIARVGIASNRTKVTVSGAVSGSDSQTHSEPYFGLGLNYAITPSFDIGVAWDATRLNYAGEKANVNALSFVASLKF